jgi:hypothetical protein
MDCLGSRRHGDPAPAGWQQVDWLDQQAVWLSLLFLPLLPIASALGAATIGSDRVHGRGVRRRAAAVGIITGIVVVLDVHALGAAWHISNGWG